MTLEEILNICAGSSVDDWEAITCWGARSGPSYLDQFIPGEFDGEYQLRHVEHSIRACYRPEASIGVAWGLSPQAGFPDEAERYKAPWSEAFADPYVTNHLIDTLYNGALVFRERYVSVDGGRCMLPGPNAEGYVTKRAQDLLRTLDAIEKVSEFDRYFDQSGFKVRD